MTWAFWEGTRTDSPGQQSLVFFCYSVSEQFFYVFDRSSKVYLGYLEEDGRED